MGICRVGKRPLGVDAKPKTLAQSLSARATRQSRPTFEPDREKVYERALAALENAGVEYLLGGAFALNQWSGLWRDTKDLDLFVRPQDAGRALDALDKGGFRTETVYDAWLGKGWDGDVFVDIIWRNANGLFPVTDDWFKHAAWTELLGHDVRTLPLEETILSKMMVGNRDRFDGADILHILYASGPSADWDRLRDMAGEHIGLLVAYLHMYRWGYPERADNVPPDILDRFHAYAKQHADAPEQPFRARLMDLPSFQADVDDWGLPDPHAAALAAVERDDAAWR